ncbi:MAG: hypothetical protein QF903_13415 [Planctomycetota bacterium]|nr:hypothetical protein [Planctomycetota bacterium]MDP6762558.1 hypothetical protein [Planctomycetota bacterium]MDP6990462.1 hypothetical protein [Planctomycetota bacterium]
MSGADVLLWGVLLPAAVAALAWVAGRRPWLAERARGGGPTVRPFEAQAVALAFLLGYAGQLGLPRAPWGEVPPAAQDWLVWIVLAAGVAYALRAGRLRPLLSRPVLAAAALALLTRAMLRHHWDLPQAIGWLTGLWLGLLACQACADAVARRAPAAAALVWVLTGFALALCAGLSGSAKLAQAAAPVCAALCTLWVLDSRSAPTAPAAGALALSVLALFGLGLIAFLYSSLPGREALLLGSAPFAALGASFLWAGEGRRQVLVPLAAALIPLSLAVLSALGGVRSDPYGY